MKSNLIVASIAFSVVASALHAAEKPFTMTKQECSRRMGEWKQKHGMHPNGFSNITNVHDFDSWRPSWWVKCTERYGHL